MSRDSTIIYRSFYEAIKELPEPDQAKCWQAIFEFSLNFNEVKLTGISKTVFTLIKPQLEANIKRYQSGIIPKTKRTGSEQEAKYKRKTSKIEANVNDNVNLNGNENKNLNPNKNENVKNIAETSSALHIKFREIFLEKYLRKKGSEFSWFEKTQVGKHGKNLNGIIGQVQTKVKSKISEPGDQDYLDLWEIMLEHLPDWEFKNTFSPAGINSRFNEIFDKINNHKNGINFANIDRQTADYQAAYGTNPYGKKD